MEAFPLLVGDLKGEMGLFMRAVRAGEGKLAGGSCGHEGRKTDVGNG